METALIPPAPVGLTTSSVLEDLAPISPVSDALPRVKCGLSALALPFVLQMGEVPPKEEPSLLDAGNAPSPGPVIELDAEEPLIPATEEASPGEGAARMETEEDVAAPENVPGTVPTAPPQTEVEMEPIATPPEDHRPTRPASINRDSDQELTRVELEGRFATSPSFSERCVDRPVDSPALSSRPSSEASVALEVSGTSSAEDPRGSVGTLVPTMADDSEALRNLIEASRVKAILERSDLRRAEVMEELMALDMSADQASLHILLHVRVAPIPLAAGSSDDRHPRRSQELPTRQDQDASRRGPSSGSTASGHSALSSHYHSSDHGGRSVTGRGYPHPSGPSGPCHSSRDGHGPRPDDAPYPRRRPGHEAGSRRTSHVHPSVRGDPYSRGDHQAGWTDPKNWGRPQDHESMTEFDRQQRGHRSSRGRTPPNRRSQQGERGGGYSQ
jgi:hypothetical protein